MNGLKQQYGDRVDFIALNIDIDATLPIRQRFNMVGRSQYALIDAAGNIQQSWYGYLDEASVSQTISDYLATLG
ncbi:MAG: hypothetical protein R3E39_25535 [Anaerolineae bacterium]